MATSLFFAGDAGDAGDAGNAGDAGDAGDSGSSSSRTSTGGARARIFASDGVRGRWSPATYKMPNFTADASALRNWGLKEQLLTLEAEMLSELSYKDETESIALLYKGKQLVKLTRPSVDNFSDQLEIVRNYMPLRLERNAEIVQQVSSTIGFFASVFPLYPKRHDKTIQVLAVCTNVTRLIQQRIKHGLACRRPAEYAPQLQPSIQTPSHGSLPSGHATEAFVIANVFYELIKARTISTVDESEIGKVEAALTSVKTQLLRHAERIAINRTVAGLHFPVDSAAGLTLGKTLADFYIKRFIGLGSVTTHEFVGTEFEGDFRHDKVDRNVEKTTSPIEFKLPDGENEEDMKKKLLSTLWYQAAEEWEKIPTATGQVAT